MSQRGKRQASRLDDGPVATKRRKVRAVAVAEEEEATPEGWTARPNTDLKISAIYNRSSSEPPAELFRKDLISAMKLPDSEPLSAEDYLVITDSWKQEWEKGVQVPVNPDSLPGPTVTVISQTIPNRPNYDFKLPKSKYIRITKDEAFKTEEHWLSTLPAKADKACSYDLDNCDIAWLKIINGERANMGYHSIREDQLERVIEELEIRCWDKVQTIVKSEEGFGIEFDENVICDVCRSPDSEEGNEMVFCDCCDICVHQACYGITTIPSGSWLCRTCALRQRPECVLCPNKGGAMKCTRSGHKWAHVSCALWIPEVSIGCVEKMEPITKISNIPQSRWALICVLCRERVGACIQCSVKTCKVAYHVTCAFKHGLEMKAIIEDEQADDGVKLRSYCEKHSMNKKKERCGSASEDDDCKRKKRKDMTSEEKNQARAAKLQEIEAEFNKHVGPSDVTTHYDVDQEGITAIYNYWVLKRKAGHNKPLLAPRSEDVDFLSRQQEQADREKMRMFVQLRQDLERVRNLCYMVSRREKLSRTYFRMREQTFHKQVTVLSESNHSLSSAEIMAIKEANHGPSIYDRLYSHPNAPDLSTDFETVLARIAGISSPTPEDKGKLDLNGVRKKSYVYLNGGLDRRRNACGSMSSGSDTDIKRPIRTGMSTASSTDDKPIKVKSNKNAKEKRLSKKRVSRATVDSSTEEEELKKTPIKSWENKGGFLKAMEKEMVGKSNSDDSDDLINFPTVKKESISNIYSDSDTDSSTKGETHIVRTKAEVKEFTASSQAKNKKSAKKSNAKPLKGESHNDVKLDSSLEDDYHRDKENIKTSKKKNKDSAPSDLIVPQRQAAKKASETIRGFQGKTKPDQVLSEQEASKTSPNEENRLKSKPVKTKGKEIGKENNKTVKEPREDKGKLSGDIYEFDKDLCGEGDILAYVPQRQAAKKAAEHIKSGLQKPLTAENEPEGTKPKIPEVKSKKDVEAPKIKKEIENDKNKKIVKAPEPKGRKTPKSSISSSSSSSTSSSSSGTSSTSSSSSSESADEEDKKPIKLPLDKRSLFDPPILSKEGDKKKPIEKKNPVKKFDPVASEKSKIVLAQSSSSSSSSDSDDNTFKKTLPIKKPVPKTKAPSEPKVVETRKDKEDTNLKSAASKKLRKTPDKKLKTSDGRPELKFQQPPTERKESPRTEEKIGRRSTGDGATTQGKHSHGFNKVQSPTETRSRSHTPRKEEPRSESSNTPSKKDQVQARKRKSDDSKKHSSPSSPSRSQNKFSPIRAESHSEEKVVRLKDSPSPSRKTDKKIDTPKESPKKSESDFLASTLEREIAERKAGRESTGKNTSKKSLDRLFEKRDKLAKENEKKDSSVLSGSESSKHDKFDKNFISKTDKAHKEERSKEDINNKTHKNEELSLPKSNKEPRTPQHVSNRKHSPEKIRQKSLFSPEPETREEEKPKSRRRERTPILINEKEESVSVLKTKVEQSVNSLPVLSPITLHSESGHDKQNYVLPQLDKVDSLEVASDFQVADPDNLEPKKISSRTSSLSTAPYQHRSIFSPQPPSKDSAVAELFDFENDILAVDESVNEDGISIARDSEETRGPPLQFSFNHEFIFKEDSKEDSARETLNLVEKLRLDYAKKTAQPDTVESSEPTSDSQSIPPSTTTVEEFQEPEPEPEPEPLEQQEPQEQEQQHMELKVHEVLLEEPKIEESNLVSTLDPEPMELIAPTIPEEIKQDAQLEMEDHKVLDPDVVERTIMEEAALQMANNQHLLPHLTSDKHDLPQYETGEHYGYPPYGIPLEVGKVPGREKLDRSNSAQADERWVPPSSVPPSVHSYEHVASPYRNKWADSELMPSRHSSSSSASSTSSSSQREDIEQPKHDEMPLQAANMIPELMPFHTGIPYNSSCAMTNAPSFHFPDPAFAPVQLFPTSTCSQLPFPGATMFPHNFPYPGPPSLANKAQEEGMHMPPPNTAAFTSSSHNMALTAAMVSPPIPQLMQEPSLTPLPYPPENCQLAQSESPIQSSDTFSREPPTPSTPSIQSEEPATPKPASVGKKSPAKPTRTSARFIAQQAKSPTKSPGKSPRQPETPSGRGRGGSTGGKRGRPPGSGRGGNRGRGRGRGRGRPPSSHSLHSDSIQNKLFGTVYDFDDDEEGDSLENLRAMRERRKSSDVHDRKSSDGSFRQESSQSPKFTSPSHHNSKRYSADVRDLRPPTPVTDSSLASEEHVDKSRVVQVQPLLPGPVDMRTYSSYDTTSTSATYHNHLMEPFAASTSNERHVPDYVEELEEELQSLTTNKTPIVDKSKEFTATVVEESAKSSIDDSRNQLKVKIKGPFLDANYTSTVTPQIQPPLQSVTTTDGNTGPASSANGVASTGTSNLRRMRKKELLRQYWTQDMNMEPSSGITPTVPAEPPINRTVITIPKAVASMTSIPTREDYKAVVDANMEKKRKKEKGHDEPERRRSVGSNASAESAHPLKRRGRAPKSTTTPVATAPKLKIKIGGTDGNQMSVAMTDDRKNLRVRPPKKRLSSVAMPTVEEMKRESMKFRKLMMAGFDEEEKVRGGTGGSGGGTGGGAETGSRKRKKQRQAEPTSVHVIADESAPKLIIRFGKRPDDSEPLPPPLHPPPSTLPTSDPSTPVHSERTSECSALPKVRTSKTMPIRLKLSRCEEGYVMKVPSGENNKTSSELSVVETSQVEHSAPPQPLLLSKHCEVR